MAGVAARGLVNGRGPSLAMGGTKSELVPTKPGQTYIIPSYICYSIGARTIWRKLSCARTACIKAFTSSAVTLFSAVSYSWS